MLVDTTRATQGPWLLLLGRPVQHSSPEGGLVVRAPPDVAQAARGGHESQVVGHTGRRRTRGEGTPEHHAETLYQSAMWPRRESCGMGFHHPVRGNQRNSSSGWKAGRCPRSRSSHFAASNQLQQEGHCTTLLPPSGSHRDPAREIPPCSPLLLDGAGESW